MREYNDDDNRYDDNEPIARFAYRRRLGQPRDEEAEARFEQYLDAKYPANKSNAGPTITVVLICVAIVLGILKGCGIIPE